jgi:hypothetical protein
MYELDDGAIGRVVPVTSLTTTSLTANVLRVGGVGNQKYSQKWIIRPEASNTADRVRYSTDFVPSTGVISHAGANYADTTATDEEAEIAEFEPMLFDSAVQKALQRVRRDYRCIIPTRPGVEWYGLSDFDWIEKPGDIKGVKYVPSPVLTRNRGMRDWSLYSSAAALLPDFWTLNGSGATLARSTTGNRRDRYTAALTRVGADCYLEQTVGLLWNGVGEESLRGETVGAACVVQASAASRAYVSITDGITETTSDAHTGGSTPEELSVSHTVSTTATTLAVRLHVKTGNTTAYFDEGYAFRGTLSDAIRRDAYAGQILPYDDSWIDQTGPGELRIRLPQRGYGGQYVLHAPRPYSPFPEARVWADSHDADATDAPTDLVAMLALANLYEGLASSRQFSEKERSFYQFKKEQWEKRAQPVLASHLYENAEHGVGATMLNRRKGLAPAVPVGGWR